MAGMGGLPRRGPDLDFYLHRVFRKKSFRLVNPHGVDAASFTNRLPIVRPLQREVIHAVVEGQDVFLQASTSFGKSLCFQLPAVISTGGEYLLRFSSQL